MKKNSKGGKVIRGDFVDLTEEQLNDLTDRGTTSSSIFQDYEKANGKITKKTESAWQEWAKANNDKLLQAAIKDSEWYGSALYGSIGLREQAIEAGYRIKSLYPCYHQGWEMDEWGATGMKDGKYYVLETSHGSLCTPREIELSKIEKVVINILKFLGMD